MKYLFGDTTPFPLEENFIDTLQAVTDCCVSLLRIDSAAEASRRAAEDARVEANREIADLEELGKAVKNALAARLGRTDRVKDAAEIAAERLAVALDTTLKQNRTAVLRKRDNAVASIGLERSADQVLETLGRFLRTHHLPGTEWRLRWKASADAAEAHVSCAAECGLQAVMEVDVPAEHPWSRALPVAHLAEGLALELPCERAWPRSGTRLRRESLDKLTITQVEVGKDRKVVVLARGKRELTNAFEIILRAPGTSRPTLKRLDGGPDEVIELDGHNGDAIARLWSRIEDTVAELSHHRAGIVLATLDNQSVRDIPRPQDIAEAILDSVGPLVREMRRRSRMPGEITLKRELGCGRREELFIPKQDLQRRFGDLAPHYRDLFEAYGLDATSEIVTTERARPVNVDDLPALVAPPPPPPKVPTSATSGSDRAARGSGRLGALPGVKVTHGGPRRDVTDDDAETKVPVRGRPFVRIASAGVA